MDIEVLDNVPPKPFPRSTDRGAFGIVYPIDLSPERKVVVIFLSYSQSQRADRIENSLPSLL